MMAHRVLILGGTTDARQLAGRLAARPDIMTTLSLAGRTTNPIGQPVPTRTGGFGGPEGLADYLRTEHVDLLVDATHPYAARISANAAVASQMAGVRILALRRPAWAAVDGDRWTLVDDSIEAVAALGAKPRRVLLALGRQEVEPIGSARQHAYIVRSVDPIDPPLDVPDATYIIARGPFDEADERRLLIDHRIDAIVAKNSGGDATYGKIVAARKLGIEVVLVRRPLLPQGDAVETVDEALARIDHWLTGVRDRGE